MNTEPLREWMITHQIRPWNVFDERVLDALRTVRREEFVPERYRELAFADTEIPLPHGQCMLKPVIEGRLLQAAEADDSHSALVIGTGSGFFSACLAQLAGRVTAVDIHAELTDYARERLDKARLHNVELVTSDYQRFEPGDAFDSIVVTGSMPLFDERLPELLKPDGRLVVTTGTAPAMTVEVITRTADSYSREPLFETVLPRLENVRTPPAFRF